MLTILKYQLKAGIIEGVYDRDTNSEELEEEVKQLKGISWKVSFKRPLEPSAM